MIRAIKGFFRLLTFPLLGAAGDVLWTLAIPAFRALAGVMLIIAAVALASDLGPVSTTGLGNFHATAVIGHWQQMAPDSLDAIKTFLTTRTRPWVWDAVSSTLHLPAAAFFVGVGLMFGYLGRHRRSVEIFVN